MAPLPVIPDVYRIVLLWNTLHGVTPRNVFHVSSASGDVDVVASQVNDALKEVTNTACFAPMGADREFDQISITPLDGSTATSIHTIEFFNGEGTSGEESPASSSVVSFRTAHRGAQGRGRMYLGPLPEHSMANGVLDSTFAATQLDGWEHALAKMATFGLAERFVVASYVHVDAHIILNVSVDELVGTQRRRQDQLR